MLPKFVPGARVTQESPQLVKFDKVPPDDDAASVQNGKAPVSWIAALTGKRAINAGRVVVPTHLVPIFPALTEAQ